MDPHIEQHPGMCGGDPHAAGDVLPVGDDKVDSLTYYSGEEFRHRAPSPFPYYISDNEYLQRSLTLYFAYSTARVSRMTVTLICPG